MSLEAYRQLQLRVSAFADASHTRGADLQCRAGCDGCCRVSLSVCDLEADALRAALGTLPEEERQRLRNHAAHAEVQGAERCVFLNEDGRCAVYDARPLVCRSQGLALSYSPGILPVEAILAEGHSEETGEVEQELTWCPLNFQQQPPEEADVLGAEKVDTMLALMNQQHCAAKGSDPLARTLLLSLAAE